MAVGGSTNAIVHLIAMAGRAGIKLPLEKFDEISRRTPRLADLRPAGRFLMEDFYFAGGLPRAARDASLTRLCSTANRSDRERPSTLAREHRRGAEIWNPEVIRPRDNPLSAEGGTAVLRGNLCPNGAVIKHAAMEPRFLKHTGPAVVFKDYDDLAARLDDPALDVTADSRDGAAKRRPRSARRACPSGACCRIPKKLLEAGVRDMLRISDARMSGTSYGACVLHVAPGSARSAARSRSSATAT